MILILSEESAPLRLVVKDLNLKFFRYLPASHLLPKPSKPNPYLNRIDPRIRLGHPGIRDMLKPHFRREIMLFPQKVHPNPSGRREINLRSSFWHIRVRK